MKGFSRYQRLTAVAILAAAFWLSWNWSLVENVVKPVTLPLWPKVQPAQQAAAGEQFSYPSLGITAPFSEHPQTSPLVIADWPKLLPTLRQGLSLSYANDDFSKANFAYLVGHSSDTIPEPYAAIFAGLGQAKVGDRFTLSRQGTLWQYQVVSREIVDPGNMSAFSEAQLRLGHDPSKPELALVTCWPVFTTRERLIVLGELELKK